MKIPLEKTKEKVRRLKIIGESISGIPELQSGAEVPVRLMPEGTQYEKGDIIVFYRDEIKIIHRVEYIQESKGKIFYVTTGLNAETNQYVDSSLVSQDDVIGKVDHSKEAYLELNEMIARRYVPFIIAYRMTHNLEVELTNFMEKKEAVLQNALNIVMKKGKKEDYN